jgi:hypothetical protein
LGPRPRSSHAHSIRELPGSRTVRGKVDGLPEFVPVGRRGTKGRRVIVCKPLGGALCGTHRGARIPEHFTASSALSKSGATEVSAFTAVPVLVAAVSNGASNSAVPEPVTEVSAFTAVPVLIAAVSDGASNSAIPKPVTEVSAFTAVPGSAAGSTISEPVATEVPGSAAIPRRSADVCATIQRWR